ncbi:MAG: hypothetical protein ACFFD1_15680, partial [Candidatus Thorarchaeota archaeon]
MGFSTLIDIVGSIIIGGFLLLLLWRIDDSAVKNVYNGSEELILQRNLTTSAEILERDFRRIGYCQNYQLALADSTSNIVLATDTCISFKTDVYDVGKIDTLKYYIGSTSELTSTPNPRDRYLYRVVNNETPVKVNLGITNFRLVYFNFQGDTLSPPIANKKLISTVEINLAVENVEGYGGESESDKY